MTIKRFLKILHELGAIGMMGALATHLILVIVAQRLAPVEHAAVRRGIEAISRYLLLPSLTVTLVSGFLSIAVHPPFHDAWWAWIKLLLGLVVLEGTLGAVMATAHDAAILSAQVAAGQADAVAMADVARHEWGGLFTLLALSLVNVVLAVWRPRFSRRAA